MRICLWRSILVGVVLALATGWRIPTLAAHAARNASLQLSLPAPTGPHRVGTTSLHLIDSSRSDPLAPTPRARELVVRLWYPAARTTRQPVATYLPATVATLYIQFIHANSGSNHPDDLLALPNHSRQDAPAIA